jgi:CelD/BcsL family acetyltransferase involved in cellulose biosynthesis
MSDAAICVASSRSEEATIITARPLAPAGRPFASVSVHTSLDAPLSAWRELAATAEMTPYQSPDWILPWLDTVGASLGIAPLIVVARDDAERPVALLPLGLEKQGSLRVASFLGAKDSNFNMGLFKPGSVWSRETLTELLRRAAAASDSPVDLFAFRNQPREWQGTANPLMALSGQASPSFAYKTALVRDPEAFIKAHLSRDTRKKLRQKMNRLRALGAVSVIEARSPAERTEILDAFEAQRTERNRAAGIGAEALPALRGFLDRTVGQDGPVTFFGLRCGNRIVATLGGLRHAGRFSGMLTSFTAEADVARASPGELLLAEVMRQHCAAGFATFDLGIGEARYKETYCPEAEELFDSLVALTPRGHLFARGEGLRLNLKRAIKQSRWAWPLVQRLRRFRAAVATRDPAEGSGRLADDGTGLQD